MAILNRGLGAANWVRWYRNKVPRLPVVNCSEERLAELEDTHQGQPIERPEWWGGYLVRPVSIEFWQGRPNRLHDRLRYTLMEDLNWNLERLQP